MTYPVEIDDQLLYFFINDAQQIGSQIIDDYSNDSLSQFFKAYGIGGTSDLIADYQLYSRINFGIWFVEYYDSEPLEFFV